MKEHKKNLVTSLIQKERVAGEVVTEKKGLKSFVSILNSKEGKDAPELEQPNFAREFSQFAREFSQFAREFSQFAREAGGNTEKRDE